MTTAEIARARRRLFIDVALRHPGDVQAIVDAVGLLSELNVEFRAVAVRPLGKHASGLEDDLEALLELAELEKY